MALYGFCECDCGQRTALAHKTSALRGRVKGEPNKYLKGHWQRGRRTHNWKGDEAGYFAIHSWRRRHRTKTGQCEECGERPDSVTHWANISGEYRREDDSDWLELCIGCHNRRDIHKRKKRMKVAA